MFVMTHIEFRSKIKSHAEQEVEKNERAEIQWT